jgi:heptosyltransferase-1
VRVLIVKLSSLGDVVHALPVVADIHAKVPDALIDWVVEPAFAPLLRHVRGIAEVIQLPLRRWARSGWFARATLGEVCAFVGRLRRDRYDAVIDLQGLSKSAIVAGLARGPSYGLANRTEGASHEGPARWLVTHPIRVEPKSHALDRSRELVGRALHVATDAPPAFGLEASGNPADAEAVVFIHGSSREDKLWPETQWIELGRRIAAAGGRLALPQSDPAEQARAARIAAAIGAAAEVWPAMPLDALIDRLAGTAGAIGVDSGPSHIAVALNLPHVQIYNHPTAWRTGPQERHGHGHQISIEGVPTPTVDAVWAAWQRVQQAAPAARARSGA